MALTQKQRRFVEEYLTDLNATQAAIRAGYSKKTAGATGHENLRKPEIAAAVEAANNERSRRTGITADMVIQELAKLAMSNMGNYYDAEGNLIPVHELPEHATAAIHEVIEEEVGPVKRRKYKLADKGINLERLGKHFRIFGEKQASDEDDPATPVKVEVSVTDARKPHVDKPDS